MQRVTVAVAGPADRGGERLGSGSLSPRRRRRALRGAVGERRSDAEAGLEGARGGKVAERLAQQRQMLGGAGGKLGEQQDRLLLGRRIQRVDVAQVGLVLEVACDLDVAAAGLDVAEAGDLARVRRPGRCRCRQQAAQQPRLLCRLAAEDVGELPALVAELAAGERLLVDDDERVLEPDDRRDRGVEALALSIGCISDQAADRWRLSGTATAAA